MSKKIVAKNSTDRIVELFNAALQGGEAELMALRDAFRPLIRKELKQNENFVMNMLGEEDALMEADLAFMNAFRTFTRDITADPERFAGYFKSVLHRNLQELACKEWERIKHQEFSLDETDEDGNPLHELEVEMDDSDLDSWRELLSPEEYKVIHGRYVIGFDLRELAVKLGCSYAHIKRIHSSAVEKLHSMM